MSVAGDSVAETDLLIASPRDRNKPLHILFVHTGLAEVQNCLRELEHAHTPFNTHVVSTPKAFVDRLSSESYDVVLAEYPMPGWQGAPPLEVLRHRGTQPPLIFVAHAISLETVAELLSQGAADCIEVQHIGHLPVVLRRVLQASNLREERDRAERRLRHSEAHYRALVGNLVYGMCRTNCEGRLLNANDALAAMLGYSSKEELLNAGLLDEIFADGQKKSRMLGRVDQETQPAPLEVDWQQKGGISLKVRLSGREADDEHGQMDGYEIVVEDITKQRELEDHLRQLAAKDPLTGLANYRVLVDVLDSEIRRSERTGREFALVLPETTAVSAELVAQRIRETLALDGRGTKLSASIGVAAYPKAGSSIGQLLSAADASMYAMKDQQRRSFPAIGASAGSGDRTNQGKT